MSISIDNKKQQTVLAMSQSLPSFIMIVKDIYKLRDEVKVEISVRIDELKYNVTEVLCILGKVIKDKEGNFSVVLQRFHDEGVEFNVKMKFFNLERGPYIESFTFSLQKGDIWRILDSMPGDYVFGKETKREIM